MELNAKNKIHGNKMGTGQPLYDKQKKEIKIQVFLY
jgi:hypothetical protein